MTKLGKVDSGRNISMTNMKQKMPQSLIAGDFFGKNPKKKELISVLMGQFKSDEAPISNYYKKRRDHIVVVFNTNARAAKQ